MVFEDPPTIDPNPAVIVFCIPFPLKEHAPLTILSRPPIIVENGLVTVFPDPPPAKE
jgi:hypothetical protein